MIKIYERFAVNSVDPVLFCLLPILIDTNHRNNRQNKNLQEKNSLIFYFAIVCINTILTMVFIEQNKGEKKFTLLYFYT